MAVSSVNQSGYTSANPYSQDKELFASLLNGMSEALKTKDFDAAEDIFGGMQKLQQKKTNKRMSADQEGLAQAMESVSKALESKDATAAKEALAKVQEQIKDNKGLTLRTHSMAEIKSQLTDSFINALYA